MAGNEGSPGPGYDVVEASQQGPENGSDVLKGPEQGVDAPRKTAEQAGAENLMVAGKTILKVVGAPLRVLGRIGKFALRLGLPLAAPKHLIRDAGESSAYKFVSKRTSEAATGCVTRLNNATTKIDKAADWAIDGMDAGMDKASAFAVNTYNNIESRLHVRGLRREAAKLATEESKAIEKGTKAQEKLSNAQEKMRQIALAKADVLRRHQEVMTEQARRKNPEAAAAPAA